jgi:hypothetical protein
MESEQKVKEMNQESYLMGNEISFFLSCNQNGGGGEGVMGQHFT